MCAKVSSLCHRGVLDLHANQTESKANDPSCVIDRFKFISRYVSVSYNTTVALSGQARANEVEYEEGHTHIDGIAIQDKLAVVGTGRRSLYQCVSYVGNTYPNTTNKI